ncbi:MAG: bi-domain-containing oxidoreductase [Candidatus Cloacimonetes bacterium]|nr:bi-domain-containing oxidoreductase [Candidatus Cloacimonadota bacterium]
MHQLTQNLKTGKMEILEVPFPALNKGQILVRNYYSLISAGTEGMKVVTARKGYIGKAKEKPEQVKQVIDTLRKEGFSSTYKKVMNKLDALSPLGYSTSGVIEAIGESVSGFSIGDRVACAGADIANHAELVSVPENLIAKVPDNVDLKHAAYTTVASIALQGIRQADLRLGESCAVIGLGLIGQLTVQMLKASGIKVFGIDIDQNPVDLAKKSGADLVFLRSDNSLEEAIWDASNGYGVDAVIITAATTSLDPVNFAGILCRSKGKVVIVGAVPTGFDREIYYKKELELKMSTSYGPGRYNPNYEEKGLDYPIGYVRWTENRNMQAFLQLLADQKIALSFLTTHTFDFEKATDAYQMIMDKSEPYIGILLKYDTHKELEREVFKKLPIKYQKSDVNIGFIGAGTFAQNSLLPNIKNANMVAVSTHQGHSTRNVADKYGFHIATGDSDNIINNKDVNTVFIATRHNLHAEYVIKSIKAGKNVFTEKPLCMNEKELEEITELYKNANKNENEDGSRVMVGFNRRFSPHIQKIKKIFSSGQPKAINYRINAGAIPADTWIQDKEIGGGRIIGEVCHFVDLAMFIADSLPHSLSANAIMDVQGLLDTLNVNISFKDGSIANVSYFANGSKKLKKERFEVFSNGVTAIIDDFKELHIYEKRHKKSKLINQDKGHKEEVKQFLNSIREGNPAPIPFKEVYWSTKMSFDIIKSITHRKTINYS